MIPKQPSHSLTGAGGVRPRAFVAAILAVAAVIAFAGSARAAETWSPNAWNDCTLAQGQGILTDPNEAFWDHALNSGRYDASGKLYVACGQNAIRTYGADGARLADIPTGVIVASGVAPSPNGQYLYLARGSYPPVRLTRQPGGNYTTDSQATWSLASYTHTTTLNNTIQSPPYGHSIDTDGDGNIYISDGTWVNHGKHGSDDQNHNRILKYSPSGNLLAAFGRRLAGSPALGDFHSGIHGIAVTPDGSRVYAADGLNNRIQIFQRQGNGSYVATSAFGNTAPNLQAGHCNAGPFDPSDKRMSSPYGVSLDGDGSVYVLNTTCNQVLKFDADGTSVISRIAWTRPGGMGAVHGFAVSRDGRRIHLQQNQLRIDRTDTPPPDETCDGLAATIVGSVADLSVEGTAGNDVIVTPAGEFTIDAGPGDDLICAGPGYDTIRPGPGSDWVSAGGASNAIDYSDASQPVRVDLAAGTAVELADQTTDSFVGVNEAFGGSGNDQLLGSGARDFLAGNGGDDSIEGRGGNDLIWGDPSWGGSGDDVIDPGSGPDTVIAGPGADSISAADGEPDSVDCGEGQDSGSFDAGDALTGCEPAGPGGPGPGGPGGPGVPPVVCPDGTVVADTSLCPAGPTPRTTPCEKAKQARKSANRAVLNAKLKLLRAKPAAKAKAKRRLARAKKSAKAAQKKAKRVCAA